MLDQRGASQGHGAWTGPVRLRIQTAPRTVDGPFATGGGGGTVMPIKLLQGEGLASTLPSFGRNPKIASACPAGGIDFTGDTPARWRQLEAAAGNRCL